MEAAALNQADFKIQPPSTTGIFEYGGWGSRCCELKGLKKKHKRSS